MKALAQSSSFFVRRFVGFVSMLLAAAALAPSASAQLTGGTPVVSYTPSTSLMGGQIPYTRFYDLEIKSPSSVASNNPVTVSIQLSINSKPTSVSDATALGYVTLSTPTLSYTGPNQTRSVRITVTVPITAEPGSYGYQVLAVGFPPNAQGSLVNVGASIDSTITAADVLAPPTVGIVSPADGAEITVSSLPASIPLSFTASSTGITATPITSVAADLDSGTSVAVSASGLGTTSVTASGTLTVNSYGIHTITASATNQGGTATDTNSFKVLVLAPPPTVVIDTPTVGATYTYRVGSAPTVVPFTFTARSNVGAVRTLMAKVDGASVTFTPSGIGTATATGSINLPYTTAGAHTLEVTTTDDVGTATATSNFTVTVIAPTPAIDITNPTEGQIFDIPTGQTTVNVPFRFVTTSNNGFVVDSVTASVGTTTITAISTTGLGTATATSTGTLTGLGAGTYTLSATGTSAGINVSDSVRFTVRAATNVPPSVVINTPAPNATFTRVSGGPALQIPLTFTGTSNTPGGVITQLRASLGSTTLSVTPTNLNQKVATGNAVMTVSNSGTYTISVTAIDAYGVANATSRFTVCVVQGKTVCGETFFDVDFDGVEDCDEFGLSGITVKLYSSTNQLLGTDVTDACGNYSFSNIAPGTYTVTATASSGLKATTPISRTITVGSYNVCVSRMGFGLDFVALKTMSANGYTIGFWKNNIDKAIQCKTNGIQISANTLKTYTCRIGDFALSVYDNISLKTASTTMSYNGSNASQLLSKQLIASEYNYQNGAYLNGNKTLTFLFLYWGEYVLRNESRYSTSYRIWAKDWFDAYNNSHGGLVNGPNP